MNPKYNDTVKGLLRAILIGWIITAWVFYVLKVLEREGQSDQDKAATECNAESGE